MKPSAPDSPALFISLDGIDGTGKSTQCNRLARWLIDQGHSVVTCVDPGGTELGDQLRAILLDHRHEMSVWAETMLFMASRAELVHQVIRPALRSGSHVISDRFLLANVVYQGHAGGLDPDQLWQIGRAVTEGTNPDLTLVLDLPVERAVARRGRAPDRMEARDREFRERVRRGFLKEAERDREHIRVIDASGSIEEVHTAIVDQVRLELKQ